VKTKKPADEAGFFVFLGIDFSSLLENLTWIHNVIRIKNLLNPALVLLLCKTLKEHDDAAPD
jgi:hypothetical protein